MCLIQEEFIVLSAIIRLMWGKSSIIMNTSYPSTVK